MADDRGLLDGVRILEFGQVIAGNYAGVLLSDLGADVIKIESASGDPARNVSVAPLRGESALHLTVNRGKRSVVLNLKSDEGRKIFFDLARNADAVLDNFRPGVLERLGIDYTVLRELNPAIVSVSVSGFGQYGPARDRSAFDLVIQALSGHMSVTGEADGPPVRMGAPMADLIGGAFGAMSVLAALVNRGRTGRGRRADVSMLDCLVSMLSYDATLFLNTGIQQPRLGSAHAHMVPWQAFATADGYVAITAREQKFWERLCEAIGDVELRKDPRAASNLDRVANRTWVVERVQAKLRTAPTEEWMRRFNELDIPAAPVNDFDGVFSDEHVRARDMVHEFDDERLGSIRYVTSPVKFSDYRYPTAAPPRLGQHTRDVLAELGLDQGTIDDLVARGIAGTEIDGSSQ